jgi:hypothetical protein
MKSIKEYINESKQLDIKFLKKAIDSMLNRNEDFVEDIFKELKTSKSIYKAIDSTNSWDDVYNEIDMINDQVSLGTNIDEIKEMTEKYDQQISKYICKGWSKFIK